MSRMLRSAVTLAAMAFTSLVVTVAGWASADAAGDPPITTACAGTTVGSTFTMTADCDTTASLTVPDGFTVDGAGHTITAHDPAGGNFTGAVVTNAGTSMTLKNLTVRGTGFAVSCAGTLIGILFNDAGGAVTDVRVMDITQHSGCILGHGIRVNALAGTARTVTITGTTVTGFQRSGLVASGQATVDVSASTFGPADAVTPGLVAQNAVQYGVGGAGGTFTGNTVVGRGYGGATNASTAILLFTASHVTITGNTITGAGTDIGISVNAGSTDITIKANAIGRTAPDSPDASGDGVTADASSAAGTSLVCNTFSGWTTDTSGISQPPCISTTSVGNGTVGATYSQHLDATVTSPPGTWAVSGGALPPGLVLATGGTISGTPTAAGTFTFAATVTDADGVASSRSFTIVVAAASTPSPSLPASAEPTASGGPELPATGTPPSTWPAVAVAVLLLTTGGALVASTARAGAHRRRRRRHRAGHEGTTWR
jgi:Putative Ig domain/Right handed beta helix region